MKKKKKKNTDALFQTNGVDMSFPFISYKTRKWPHVVRPAWCQIGETRDWQLQRDTGYGDQSDEPGSA